MKGASTTYEAKLTRIKACAANMQGDIDRSLLHAYIACLQPDELARATREHLGADQVLIGALKSRLLRLGRDGAGALALDSLGAALLASNELDRRAKLRKDAVLSAIYPYLAPQTRKSVLENWMDRGNRTSTARWLKAMDGDELLLDLDAVLSEWRASRDPLAVKIFVSRSSPERLNEIFYDLVEHAEGWLIGKAAVKIKILQDEQWHALREFRPVTYAYLCAKLDRSLSEQDALEIIMTADAGPYGGRGLAIWSVGQLGMLNTLDRIGERHAELFEREAALYRG